MVDCFVTQKTDGFTGDRLMGKASRTRRGNLVRLFRKQRGKCYLCGGQMALRLGRPTTATIDHVIPRSKHYNEPRNRKAACLSCNNAKRDMSEGEYRQQMERSDEQAG